MYHKARSPKVNTKLPKLIKLQINCNKSETGRKVRNLVLKPNFELRLRTGVYTSKPKSKIICT